MNALELHPLCTLFPRLAGAEFDALKADIIAHGLCEPITVYEGMVLDGGNRYRACIEAGVEPALKEFTGNNPASFVLSANMHRRHLAQGQMAAIVAGAQDWSRAQTAGGDRRSDHSATLHNDSAADRAATSGVSLRTQQMADKLQKADPDLAKQVRMGEISLPKALEKAVPAPSIATPQPAPIEPVVVSTGQAADDIDLPSEDEDHFDQLIEENKRLTADLEAARAEVAALTARVVLLTRDDLASQINELTEKCARLDSLARSRLVDVNDALGEVAKKKDLFDKLRKAAGIGEDGNLFDFIKHAARRPA